MRKSFINFSLLICFVFLVITLFLQSCGTEDPSYDLKTHSHLEPMPGGGWGGRFLESGIECEGPGSDCKIVQNGEHPTVAKEFNTFKGYYLHNDLKTYFDLHKDYNLILPEIDKTDFIGAIVSGKYLVKIFEDNSIVIYNNDGKELSYNNLIFSFVPDKKSENK